LHGIGLQIKLPHEQRDSKHLDIKAEFSRFSQRLDTFVALADVVVVAPGGVGTMLELCYVWQLMQVHQTRKLPIILLGDMWPEFVAWVRHWPLKHKMLDKMDVDMLYLAKDSGEAMRIIGAAHDEFKRGPSVSAPRYRPG
jgi:predicted Rossmann-fold nucleotide-binding protein